MPYNNNHKSPFSLEKPKYIRTNVKANCGAVKLDRTRFSTNYAWNSSILKST